MIWFPTSQGRFYQNEDFGLVGAVADHLEAGRLQIACVDSVDAESFYAASKSPADRIRRHDQYDWLLPDARRARLSGTTDMIRIFEEKGIRNRASVWAAPYGHDWPWWKEQIRHYVP